MNTQIRTILEIVQNQHPDSPVMKGVMAVKLGLPDPDRLTDSYNSIVEAGYARLEKCNRTRGWYLVLTSTGEAALQQQEAISA